MVGDLLAVAREHEWVSVKITCGRGCCCYIRTDTVCPDCDGHQPDHTPGCGRAALMAEAEAFLRAEQEAMAPVAAE
jgi:hypothetical protein